MYLSVKTNELKSFDSLEKAIEYAKNQPMAIVIADNEHIIAEYGCGMLLEAFHGWFVKNHISMSVLY